MDKYDWKEHHEAILDSINEGVFTVDLDWKITSFNRAAEKITGVKRAEAIGRKCSEVFRTSICETACVLKQVISTGKPNLARSVYMVNGNGQQIPIKISAAALRNKRGKIIGGVETFQDLRQIEALRKQLRKRYSFEDIIGRSAVMTQLFDLLPQIANNNSNVLIEGASGTGKELFARAIHNLSPRKNKKFVAVNCGALPDSLLESELFGYKAGAFTDARRDKPGRFALAQGGTIFLDEIGDISFAMQVRLLRVLQERVFDPLGAVESVPLDVRVVAATNKNLKQLVQEEKFREDLFYRIHVISLRIPLLRERKKDILPLLDHFIQKFNRLQGKDISGVSQEVLSILMEYDFPGNVRELQNIVEHCFVLCQEGAIEIYHLPQYLRAHLQHHTFRGIKDTGLQNMEKFLVTETLAKYGGNRTKTAKALGIHVSTLYRKIRAWQLPVPKADGRSSKEYGLM